MAAPPPFDLLIVGSGPSGSHAAMEAVASGRKVALVEIGYSDGRPPEFDPSKTFSEIRRTDPNQHTYFLGDNPVAVLRNQGRAGPHLTPGRQYMIRDMDQLFPLESDSFLPLQSSGLGGLGISWGANCFALESYELERIGISAAAMPGYYASAAREAGISGRTDDALTPLIANLDHRVIQPPLPLDANAETLLRRYLAREERYKASGIYLGQSLLAMLSQNLGDRQANSQTDMDFWADVGRSVYRPRYTIEKLRASPNFTHLTGRLALRFQPALDGVTLQCRNLETGAPEAVSARKLLLAAGAINSGRLALASFRDYHSRLPILCNPNHWVAAVNLSMLGKPARDRRHSLSQLTVLMRAECGGPDYVLAQIYSYRSLLLFRLLKDIPLPPKQGLLFLRLLATAFTCVNIHFPDRPGAGRWIQLEARDSGDVLRAAASYSAAEKAWIQRHEGRMLRFLAGLRCIPIGVNKPLHGASIHYAGTLPYAEEDRPYTTTPDGQLRHAPNVYVADGASWRFMPAKGLTLTLMANARRVAAQALRDLAAGEASSS
jgi:choline dehydrogenase-like flavoprotein